MKRGSFGETIASQGSRLMDRKIKKIGSVVVWRSITKKALLIAIFDTQEQKTSRKRNDASWRKSRHLALRKASEPKQIQREFETGRDQERASIEDGEGVYNLSGVSSVLRHRPRFCGQDYSIITAVHSRTSSALRSRENIVLTGVGRGNYGALAYRGSPKD